MFLAITFSLSQPAFAKDFNWAIFKRVVEAEGKVPVKVEKAPTTNGRFSTGEKINPATDDASGIKTVSDTVIEKPSKEKVSEKDKSIGPPTIQDSVTMEQKSGDLQLSPPFKIAFIIDYEKNGLYKEGFAIINSNGTGFQMIGSGWTSGYRRTSNISWSPDCKRFAVSIYDDYNHYLEGIFLWDGVGENLTKLNTYGSYPSWSPDGKKIVYSIYGNLEIISLFGSGKKTLKFENIDAFHPVYSPDGQKIAFLAQEDGGNYSNNKSSIWITDPSGTIITKELFVLPKYVDYDFLSSMDWSPDGKNILFSYSEIHLIELGGKGSNALKGHTIVEPKRSEGDVHWSHLTHVSWLPDGDKISFNKFWVSTTMKPNGTEMKKFTIPDNLDLNLIKIKSAAWCSPLPNPSIQFPSKLPIKLQDKPF